MMLNEKKNREMPQTLRRRMVQVQWNDQTLITSVQTIATSPAFKVVRMPSDTRGECCNCQLQRCMAIHDCKYDCMKNRIAGQPYCAVDCGQHLSLPGKM